MKILGKMTVTFTDNPTPQIDFEGDIDMLKMYPLPFQISTAYSEHLNKVGDELKRKVEARGITAKKDIPIVGTVVDETKVTNANTENENAKV